MATWPILLTLAALMEVGGDAVIQQGMRRHDSRLILLGFAIVGAYGIGINVVGWDSLG